MDIFDFLASPLVSEPEVAKPEVEAPGGGMISCNFLFPSLAAFFNAFFKNGVISESIFNLSNPQTNVIRELRPEFKFPAKIEMAFSQILAIIS